MAALIQIVDEYDVPLRGGPVEDARREGLFHRIVRVIIEDHKGHVLLQKRALKLDDKPGFWDSSASGHVDEGESYEQAALRELEEELGFQAKTLELIDRFQSHQERNGWILNRFNNVFRIVLPTPIIVDKIQFSKEEVDSVRLFSPREIKDLLADPDAKLTNGLRRTLEAFYT